MKKIKLLLLIAFLSITFVSCYEDCNYQPHEYASYYYTIRQDEWYTHSEGVGHWYTNLNFPEITYNAVNNGGVLVYFRTEYALWQQLPYTTVFADYSVEYSAAYESGVIRMDYINFNSVVPPPSLEIKVVVLY